ncbi:MAG TPA: hypothetical protein VIO58_03910 [Candidatus Methanoperedens sp.]
MKKLLILAFIIGVLFSGCIEEKPISDNEETAPVTNVIQETPPVIATPDNPVTETPTPVITSKPENKYDSFVSWLKTDTTDKHAYVLDNSRAYGEQYVCSQFTKDFITNATSVGFEVYAVELTGAMKGQNAWHMLAAVILDDNLYFVDPQTDKIIKKEDMFKTYGYAYAYFGKDVYISRNDAQISMPVNYHKIIGLNGQNYLYLN